MSCVSGIKTGSIWAFKTKDSWTRARVLKKDEAIGVEGNSSGATIALLMISLVIYMGINFGINFGIDFGIAVRSRKAGTRLSACGPCPGCFPDKGFRVRAALSVARKPRSRVSEFSQIRKQII